MPACGGSCHRFSFVRPRADTHVYGRRPCAADKEKSAPPTATRLAAGLTWSAGRSGTDSAKAVVQVSPAYRTAAHIVVRWRSAVGPVPECTIRTDAGLRRVLSPIFLFPSSGRHTRVRETALRGGQRKIGSRGCVGSR